MTKERRAGVREEPWHGGEGSGKGGWDEPGKGQGKAEESDFWTEIRGLGLTPRSWTEIIGALD